MKILLIMNPGLPVPPKLYGGIERIVYYLAEEYHRMGHEVTLLAGPDSYCSGHTVTFGFNAETYTKTEKLREIGFVWQYLLSKHTQFDLIHNFGRLIYFFPILRKPVNKFMSYQRQVSQKGIKITSSLHPKNLTFTACSQYCVSTGNVTGRWKTVYNTIDFSRYQLNKIVPTDAPLIFLGRIEQIKGIHTAIEVAKATGNKLWIAGNIADKNYFESNIAPYIDGEQIVYLGELNDAEKNTYLRQSKAMLFPIEWDEPFGIVMIEAMACGTPVIGFNRGAVQEVVDEGITGYKVQNAAEMIIAVKSFSFNTRAQCRAVAEDRFSIHKIARDYLNLT